MVNFTNIILCVIIPITPEKKGLKGGKTHLKCVFMKTKNNKETKRIEYIIALVILIFTCELMFQFNNMLIKFLGICILPIIITYGILLIRNEQKEI